MNKETGPTAPTWTFLSALAVIAASALFSFFSTAQEPATNTDAPVEKRVEFLQRNFSKFVPFEFKKSTNSTAAIQTLHARENTFVYDGTNYCGFKFTVPEWLDGDFEWMYLFAKTETNQTFRTRGPFSWYIIPEIGRSKGFKYYQADPVSFHPQLKARFPYTGTVTIQSLNRERLVPGKTYGIWFGFNDQDLPDIAFAMTIDSDRGAKEFGILPDQ